MSRIHPMHPYDENWSEQKEYPSWITSHVSDIERIYTRLWQEIYSVLGHEMTMDAINIHKFVIWLSTIIGQRN